jgi:hypothetical protein
MKNKNLFITLVLGLSLTLALLWVLGAEHSSAVAAPGVEHAQVPNTPADDLRVCPTGPPACPYNSIQDAVDAASGFFPTIQVAAGTYTGVHVRPRNDITTTGFVTQVVYLNKPLALEGGYTTTNWTTPDPVAHPTILDAQGRGGCSTSLVTTGDWFKGCASPVAMTPGRVGLIGRIRTWMREAEYMASGLISISGTTWYLATYLTGAAAG